MLAVQILSFALILCACIYYPLCLAAAHYWRRRSAFTQSNAPAPVTILKPLRGDDPEQYANFESFCRLDYPVYQIVFGALDPNDPGLYHARRLQAAYPHRDIVIVAGGEAFGLNRKVCNLQSMLAVTEYDLIVVCDSDMRVSPDYLQRVTAPFDDKQTGLVTCLYRGCQPRSLAAKLEALAIGLDFLPGVLLANWLSGIRFALGATIAVRRQVLEEIGGFRSLADELADDYRLGERAAHAGWRVVLSDYIVDNVMGAQTFGEMWARRLRWAKTTRAMQPGGWAGYFVTYGTITGLLFLAANRFQLVGWIGLGIVWTLRGVTATMMARLYTQDQSLSGRLPLLYLSDLVSFALWVCSYFGRTICWRGERFRLGAKGRLERLT
jgi:ceramide glucosyltransferase